eukprot:2420640-Rhodomonas_salina.1
MSRNAARKLSFNAGPKPRILLFTRRLVLVAHALRLSRASSPGTDMLHIWSALHRPDIAPVETQVGPVAPIVGGSAVSPRRPEIATCASFRVDQRVFLFVRQ